MNDAFQITFGLLGGLAIFIFGMNMMSESLQKAAGEKMKKILGILTVNPVMGVLAGTIATAVMQSSSATTVMVIGFVSAGLMTLKEGISVILGANIGTTMTAQLLAFNISDYIFVIIFVGFIVSFVFKSEKIKSIGQTIFAFGLLFEGIQIMSSVMKPLAASPVFINMIDHVSGAWRTGGNADDSGGAKQQRDHCGSAELCSAGRPGWRFQHHRSGGCHPCSSGG